MSTTHIEERPRVILPRASRSSEILAILLLAAGLLLALCLISAAFYPNDPSWNSAGQSETQNWAGAIGANVAATAFQFIGLAAYLLPLLLFAAAWRRFRRNAIQSPLTRIAGLLVLVVAASALLSISHLHPLFDSSVQPGGLLGSVVAQGLASGLSRIGATILLVAIAASGLLLATNFSFIRLYEIIVNLIATRFAFIGRLPERFSAWRQLRREQAAKRKETKAALKAEREAARGTLKQTLNLTAAERVADFMKDTSPIETAKVIRGDAKRTSVANVEPEPPIIVASVAAGAAAGATTTPIPTVSTERSSRRSISPTRDEADDVEEMVKGASVLRVKAEAPATGKLPFDANRRAVSYDDYNPPALHFLNEAPPHSEQADAELLALANRLAEKCKEFNVTGQIKQQPNTIGYVELAYASKNNLPVALIKNAGGKFVAPSIEAVTAAAAGSAGSTPDDLRVSITNPTGADAYPISSYTYILAYKDQKSAEKGKALVDFLWWGIHDGEQFAKDLQYAPLPAEIVKRAEAKINSITNGGKPLR